MGETISGQQIWKPGALVAEVRAESADRVALLHLETNQPVVLTGTAAVVWAMIDGHRTESAIIAELSSMYVDIDGKMNVQLSSFFSALEAQRLIVGSVATQ